MRPTGQASTRGGNPSRSGDDDDIDGYQDFFRLKKSRLGRSGFSIASNPYRELESYLSTAFEYGTLGENEEGDSNFDILSWWAQRKALYPITHIIAKEVLAVPASTVSVEQAFSEGGYILDKRRSSITPDNLEAQCLLHDWVNADRRKQTNIEPTGEESETYYDTNSSGESINNEQ
jgi:hAT family C-terminal dimerisation region